MGYNEEHRCLTKRKSTERDRSGSESEKAGKDKKCDCVECEERERMVMAFYNSIWPFFIIDQSFRRRERERVVEIG